MSIREDSVVFLLGAGASVDAGIIHAKEMTDDIENKVKNHQDFIIFNDLYNYLKSSIVYQRGLEGNFSDHNATIEDLLNALSELNQKHKNKLYPFIGSWNVHLLNVAGKNFENVASLDRRIREQLFSWVNITRYDASHYFKSFGQFSKEIGSPIRVFTLNYDLCVEKALEKNGVSIELGFDETGQWEASRFDKNDNTETEIYLYKLHGSIDWIREETRGNMLRKCDTPQAQPELIFGTTTKLSSIDPYLFYVHEFRKYSLLEPLRLIVTIGYSFSDDYVNRLIGQSLTKNKFAKVLVVTPNANDDIEGVAKLLHVDQCKVIAKSKTAEKFFNNNMRLNYFEELSEQEGDAPF